MIRIELEHSSVVADGGLEPTVGDQLLRDEQALRQGVDAADMAHLAGDLEDRAAPLHPRGDGLGQTPPDRVFEPFWTSKPRGSGLGLAVSRQIAREHGGDLILHDRRDGPGCAAVLTLPEREA